MLKMTLHKTALVKALTIAGNCVDKRANNPILSHVLLNAADFVSDVQMTGTDLDDTIEVRLPVIVIERPGSLAIDPKHMIASLKAFSKMQEVVTIEETDKSTIIVRSGHSMFASPFLPAADFPSIYKAEGPVAITLSPANVSTICEKVAFSANQDGGSSILNGLNFDLANGGMEVCSTDGSRLTAYAPVGVASNIESKFIVSSGSIDRLLKLAKFAGGKNLSEVRVIVDEFKSKDRVTFITTAGSLTARLIKGEYPRYSELFPVQLSGYRIFKRDELVAACKAATAADKRLNLLVVCGLEVGDNAGTVRLSLQGNSSSCKPFGINANYLRQWIEANDADEVRLKCNDAKLTGAMMLEGNQGDIRHLIMPVQCTTSFKDGKTTDVRGWWTELQTEALEVA